MYIRSDGELWEVQAQTGGDSGESKVYSCPGRASAQILAESWLGNRSQWREVVP